MTDYKDQFPLIKTKVPGLNQKFDLSDPADRRLYFTHKAGEEIAKLENYFNRGKTFIAYLLGKKNSGKGTYTKLMIEIFGQDKLSHVAFGDIIRAVHKDIETKDGKQRLADYLKANYRGYISIKQCIDAILNRTQDKPCIPSELVLTLLEREIDQHKGKTLFIDGFPRTLDQISYSLYFRALIDYRQDPDIFVAIDVPESVIDARMRSRVVCPKCHTPRHPKLLPTKHIGFDQDKNEFYLMCDNPGCDKARMAGKEGDSAGIESVRKRLELDQQLIDKIFELHGVPRILSRNAIPTEFAEKHMDNYELTPEFSYELDQADNSIKVLEKPWIVKDDQGADVYSLMAPAVALQWIKQLVGVLGL